MKVDVKHKPNMGGETQVINLNDLEYSQETITVEKLVGMRDS